MTLRYDNRRLGWALAAGGMLLVSTDSLFVRLAESDGWNIAFLTSAFAFPVHLLLHRVFGVGRPVATITSNPKPYLLIAGLSAVSQIAFITGLTRTAVANVVVIVAATPVIAAVAARVLLGERTGPRVWVAIGITIGGIVIVVAASLGEPTLSGDLLAVLAVACFAVNINLWRLHHDLDRFVALGLSGLIVMALTFPFATPFGLEPRTYLSAAAMGAVFNIAGRIANANAARFAPSAEVALFSPTETIAATAWAWIAFGETPTTAVVVGGAIVIIGMLAGTLANPSLQSRRIASPGRQ